MFGQYAVYRSGTYTRLRGLVVVYLPCRDGAWWCWSAFCVWHGRYWRAPGAGVSQSSWKPGTRMALHRSTLSGETCRGSAG